MSGKLVTRYLSEREYPVWNALVASSPQGSIYSTPEYLDVLCSETSADFRILVAEHGGEIAGGIALYERKGLWGSYVAGRLLLYYNGFVLRPQGSKYPSERTAAQVATLAALERALVGEGYGRIRIRNRHPLEDVRIFMERGWHVHPSYSYVVPIADLKALWERVEHNLRRLVTRCARDGFEVAEDSDFKSFYRLHEQTHARKHSALYLPEASFRRYFERLRAQDLCRLFHARMSDGRPVSAQLVLLGKQPVCHTVSAATDAEFLRTGATAYLRWKVFEQLSQMGYAGNDLTDAPLNAVTHFKSQLGGDLQMNLVLEHPDSTPFRVNSIINSMGHFAKHGAGGLVARLKGTKGGDK